MAQKALIITLAILAVTAAGAFAAQTARGQQLLIKFHVIYAPDCG